MSKNSLFGAWRPLQEAGARICRNSSPIPRNAVRGRLGPLFCRAVVPALAGLLSTIPLCPAQGQDVPAELSTRRPATETIFRLESSERIPGIERDQAVLTVGQKGQFDSAWLGTPDVHFDGQLYRMWYSASNVLPMYTGEPASIGLATSGDGIHWHRANGGNPVLGPGPPGSFDEAQALGPCVLYDGQLWRMWYCGLMKPGDDPKPENWAGKIPKGWEVRLRIGLATSTDGVDWRRASGGRPVLDLGPVGSTGDLQAMHPAVLREEDGYRMWYASNSIKLPHTLAMATSPDGVQWTKYRDGAPLEGLGHYITGPAVYRRGKEYLMLYSREDLEANVWVIDAAVSADGFHWKVLNQGKPVADPGPRAPRQGKRAAEEGSCFHPSAPVADGSSLRYWYVENFAAGLGGYRIALGKLNFTFPDQ